MNYMKNVLLSVGVSLGLSQSANPQAQDSCQHGSLFDATGKTYLCFDGPNSTKPKIVNGFSVEHVLELLLARENNAWQQLANQNEIGARQLYASIRAENGRKEYGKSPRVHDITDVTISKTLDTRQFVIRLQTADGVTASLWMDSGDISKNLHVRTATPY